MVRRLAALAAAVTCAGCGGDERELATPEVVDLLRASGYRGLVVTSNADLMREAAAELESEVGEEMTLSDPLDFDLVTVGSQTHPLVSLWTGTAAVRLPSVELAEQGAEEAGDREGFEASVRQMRESLPESYDPAHLLQARACNVLLSTYADEPAERNRSTDALERLLRACT